MLKLQSIGQREDLDVGALGELSALKPKAARKSFETSRASPGPATLHTKYPDVSCIYISF